MTPFATLLAALVQAFNGPKYRFAVACGLTPSALSRHLAGAVPPPPTDVCLRIAYVASASPTEVLVAAGREDVAKLIELQYGSARRPGADVMTPAERTRCRLYLELLRTLSAREQDALDFILKNLRHVQRTGRARAAQEMTNTE